MTIPLPILGAGIACALGGAVAGNALGSAPVLDRSTLATLYQSHDSEAPEESERVLPDHYPLVTRSGTVPVAALGERGLYSQARFRPLRMMEELPPQAELAAWEPERWVDDDPPAPPSAEGVSEPEADDAAQPLHLAEGPVAVADEGTAKLVNVSATLAMR